MSNYPYYSYPPTYQQPSYMQRGYAPQPSQMPQIQQQSFTPIQTPPPTGTPIQDIKFVNRAQAEAYIVYPNTKVMLIDKDGGMVYLKTADGVGQSKTEYFKFEPINEDGSPIKKQKATYAVNYDDFIKKEDVKNLGFVTVDQYNSLLQKFEQIQRQIAGGKPNVATKQPEIRT